MKPLKMSGKRSGIFLVVILFSQNIWLQAQTGQTPSGQASGQQQDIKDLRTYLSALKTDVNNGKTKISLLDFDQIKNYAKYVPLPMKDKLLSLDLSDLSVWWSSEKKYGGISGKSNLIGQPIEVRIMMGYDIKDAAPTAAEIQKSQTETEAQAQKEPEAQEGLAGVAAAGAATSEAKPGLVSKGKDLVMGQLSKLQVGVIMGLPAGFKFGKLLKELSVIDDKINISKGAISLTSAPFVDPTFGSIGEGLNLVLSINQNLEPFKWMIDFINKSKSPIKVEGTTIDLRGNIAPDIGGSQFLLQLPGVLSFQMAGKKIIESDRPALGIVLLPSKVPGVAGVGGIRIGILGGMKIFVPKMKPLDFTMEMAFDSSSKATITGQMKGLFDLAPYGLPFGFSDVGTTTGFNPENVETLGLAELGFQGKTVVGPKDRRTMLSVLMDLTLSADQTNILVNGCLVPEAAGGCLGPKGENLSKEAISVTDVVYLVIEFLNKFGAKIKFDEFKSTIPDLALNQAEFYFSPQGVYVFDKLYPQGFRVSAATEILGVTAGLNFWGSKDGIDAKGYLSKAQLGPVLLTGAGPDKKYGTADDGAFINLVYKPKSTINLGLSGSVEIQAGKLGTLKGQADADVSNSGVAIDVITKIFDQFDSEVKLSAKNFKNPTSWYFLGQFNQAALDNLTNQLKIAFQNLKAPLANLTAQAQKKVDDAKKAYEFATANIQKRISDAQSQVDSLKSKITKASADCPLISASTTVDIKQAQTTVTQKFGADYAPLMTKASDQIEKIASDIDKAKQTLSAADLEKFTIKRWVDEFTNSLKTANLKPDDVRALNIWLRQFKEKSVPPSSAVNQSFLIPLGLVFAAQTNLTEPLFSQGIRYYPSFLQRAIELTTSDPDMVYVTNSVAQAQFTQNLDTPALNDLKTSTLTSKFQEIYNRIRPTHLERANTLYFIGFPNLFDFLRGKGLTAGAKGILDGMVKETYRSLVALWAAGYDFMLGDEYNLKADYRYFPVPKNWPNNVVENAKEMAKNFYIIRSQENNPGVNSRLNNQVKLGTFILLASDFLGDNNFQPFLNNAAQYIASNVFVTGDECSAIGSLCSNNKVTTNPYSYGDYKKVILAYLNWVQKQTGPLPAGSPEVQVSLPFLFPVPEVETAGTFSQRANLRAGLNYWLASGPKNFALFMANYHSLPLVNAWKLQWNIEPLIVAKGLSLTTGGTQPNIPTLLKEKEVLLGLYNFLSANNQDVFKKLVKTPWSQADIKVFGQF